MKFYKPGRNLRAKQKYEVSRDRYKFLRRFITDLSKTSSPLTDWTTKDIGLHKWNTKCAEAFSYQKSAITSAPVFVPPSWKKQLRGHLNAHEIFIWGTLTQIGDIRKDQGIALFSKRLNWAEQNYIANDREQFGLVYFLQRFRSYLEGSGFEIFTDNQVLKHFFSKPALIRREHR